MKLSKLSERAKRVMTMIKKVYLFEKERALLLTLVKDCEKELKENNQRVLDKNKDKKDYLKHMNKNNIMINLVENLIKKLDL